MGKEPPARAFSIAEAHERLEELLERAVAGEEVIIARGASTPVKLVPVGPQLKPVPGLWKGKFEVPDSFFEPMTEDELALWYGDSDGEEHS